MIYGVINGYNEKDFVEDCVYSLQRVCDQVIYVDGAYQGFPFIGGSHKSCDGTLELVAELGALVILPGETAWKSQVEKRNQYLVGQEGDWYLMLDCDERLVGNLVYDEAEEGHRVAIKDMISGSVGHWLRLFRHQEGLEYRGGHNLLFVGDKRLRPEFCPLLLCVEIRHYKHQRDEARKLKKEEYYLYQYETEREFRLEHDCP